MVKGGKRMTTSEARHRVLRFFRRTLRKFETERTEERSTFEITIELQADELDGGWIASVVELPGCMSQGDSQDEAMRNVLDAFSEVIAAKMARSLPKHEHPQSDDPHREVVRIPVAAAAH